MANSAGTPNSLQYHSGFRRNLRHNPLGALFYTLTHRHHKRLKLPEAGQESKEDLKKKSKSASGLKYDTVPSVKYETASSATRNGSGSKSSSSIPIAPQLSSFQSYVAPEESKEGALVSLVRVKDISEPSEKDSESIAELSSEEERSQKREFQKKELAEKTSISKEDTMIDARKFLTAPANPPPPVPPLKIGSPLKMLNGSMNGTNGTAAPATNGHARPEPLKLENLKPAAAASGPSAIKNGLASKGTDDSSSKAFRPLQLNGHVGFDSLPHQLVRKCTDQGFQFNLMCVGETGTGKTTLVESLFNMKLDFPPCNNELKTVELRSKTYDVTEGGIHLKLTIVETAGFGDQLDKDKSSQVIVNYINEQFEKYLKEELRIKRCLEYYDDTRIHACLYFISPTGHGLKALDVVTMRRLSERVNVIPVIAKADTACKDELVRFKIKILSELKSHNIPIYQFPTDDETVRAVNVELNQLVPFAVVGSTDFVKKDNGKLARARRYPWGIVEVENEQHCDFVKLREAVLRTNVDSLRERTHKALYEDYRRERLRAMKVGDGDTGPKMLEAFSQKQKEFADEMAHKEQMMREEFVARVNRKEEEMKRREEMLNMRAKEVKDNFEEEMRRIDSQMNTLVEEKLKLETKAGKKLRK